MASVSISANGAISSPYLYSTATISEKSRSGTSVVLNVKIVSHLKYSESHIGSGYEFTGKVTAYGVSKSFTIKSSSSSWSGNADHTISGTMTINVPATTTSINVGYKCIVTGFEEGSKTGTSQSLALSKILASVTSATNFKDTTNPKVYFSNPSNLKVRPYLNFYDKAGGTLLLTLYPPTSKVGRYGSVLSTSYTWDLDQEYSNGLTYRNKIRNVLGAKTYSYVAVGVNTYSGTTKIGYSSKGVKFTNVLSPPTFTNFSFENIDEKTLILTGNNPSKFISGYSTLKITINDTDKAIANKGATMSHYLINGIKYSYSETFTQEIANWNKTSVEVYAVDSRGLTTKKDLPCELIPYTPLQKGNIVAKREGGVGEKTTLMYEGTIWNNWFSGEENVGTKNTIKSSIYTYQVGTGDIINGRTDISPNVTENNFIYDDIIIGDINSGFSINDAYNIVVKIEDELSSITYLALVPSGIPAMAIYKNNVALHGKYDTELGGVQVNGDLYLDGYRLSNDFKSMCLANDTTFNAERLWSVMGLTNLSLIGDKLESGLVKDTDSGLSAYGIKVKEGAKVKALDVFVSAYFANNNQTSSARCNVYIARQKADGTQINEILGNAVINAGSYKTAVARKTIVAEDGEYLDGDIFYMKIWKNATNYKISLITTANSTYLEASVVG